MKNKRYGDAQIMGILKQADRRVPVSELAENDEKRTTDTKAYINWEC